MSKGAEPMLVNHETMLQWVHISCARTDAESFANSDDLNLLVVVDINSRLAGFDIQFELMLIVIYQ